MNSLTAKKLHYCIHPQRDLQGNIVYIQGNKACKIKVFCPDRLEVCSQDLSIDRRSDL